MVTKVGINGFGRIGRLVSLSPLSHSVASTRSIDKAFRSSAMRTFYRTPCRGIGAPNWHDMLTTVKVLSMARSTLWLLMTHSSSQNTQ